MASLADSGGGLLGFLSDGVLGLIALCMVGCNAVDFGLVRCALRV